MAHTKAKGTSKLGRDSQSQRLGVKIFAGQAVKSGDIIIRQRGTKYHPGVGTIKTGDDTIVANATGKVSFKLKKVTAFTGQLKKRQFVNVS
jgi:large subunit ribosomal protein L27